MASLWAPPSAPWTRNALGLVGGEGGAVVAGAVGGALGAAEAAAAGAAVGGDLGAAEGQVPVLGGGRIGDGDHAAAAEADVGPGAGARGVDGQGVAGGRRADGCPGEGEVAGRAGFVVVARQLHLVVAVAALDDVDDGARRQHVGADVVRVP